MRDFANINNLLRIFRQPGRKDINDLILRARKHAVTIDPLDGINVDIEKLSFLDRLLENKHVVYIGEEDHWIHEKSDYRLLLIRYLISRGQASFKRFWNDKECRRCTARGLPCTLHRYLYQSFASRPGFFDLGIT
jgi:hypothetical protein